MIQEVQPHTQLGRDPRIDPGACVGYLPNRNKPDLLLVIGDNAWIRAGTIIYAGSRIGRNLETGHHAVIREENSLGNDIRIWNREPLPGGGSRPGASVSVSGRCTRTRTCEDEARQARNRRSSSTHADSSYGFDPVNWKESRDV